MKDERLDKLLVQRSIVSTRVRAEEIIRKYGVKVNGKLIHKTGRKVPVDAELILQGDEIPWVSRAAYKLIEALEKWKVEIENKFCIDIGASTGGFTEVLLANQAAKVYCVDVGKNQLSSKIKADKRVVNLEQTHVRELNNHHIPELCDICVIDVSFISLEKIFPFIHRFLKANACVIALVKPQFEVGKKNIGKGGIVKDKTLYQEVIKNIQEIANLNQLEFVEVIDSPILGGDGNKEFLMHLKKMN